MRLFCYIFGAIALIFAGFSHFGGLHPVGDSLAVFRPVWVFLLAYLAFKARQLSLKGFAAVLMIGAIVSMTTIFVALFPRAGEGESQITLYQKNMLFMAATTKELEADIRALAPDLVTLQEVSARNTKILGDLIDLYPHQHFCDLPHVGGVAVLSQFPLTEAEPLCIGRDGLAAIQVQGPTGPLWVASLHLRWPWPFEQPVQAARLDPWLSAQKGKIVIGGDFNIVPWTHRLSSIQKATGTTRAGPAPVTFWLEKGVRFYPLQIDHVLGPKGGKLERRPLLASDHHGVLATLEMD